MDKAMKIVSVFRFLSIATITISLCNGNLGVPCKQNERQALLMLKKDLKDPSNRLLSWVGEGDCCNWTGVVCDNLTGHVRELHLGNYYSDEYLNYSLYQENSLGGKVNTSLLNLKHLSYLDLSNNDFGGIQIPSFLGSLKSLRYLNLSDSKFAGIIPHQLGNLSSLRSLGLRSKSYYRMKVENLQWLSGLSSLQYLDMSRVDLSKVSDWFQVTNTLPSMLVELHTSGCELNQIPVGVANMTRLKVLNLRWNIIWGTIPQWLYTCSNLESLSLSLNLLRGEISSSIGNLTAIVNLDLSANQLEGKIPNSLGNLCKLTVLDLSRNYFNGSVSEILGSLSRCSSGQMESLKLSTNDFSGPLSDQLGNFRHLRILALSSNSISGPIPVSLGNLSFLEEVSISENHFNGTLPKTIGQLKMLRRLDISENALKGVVSEVHFTNLTRLEDLFANENSLTLKSSPDWLPPFQLSHLYLDSWHLEPSEFPMWLRSQTKLLALSMSNTGISGTFPTWFLNSSSQLGLVDLSHNELYGQVPDMYVFTDLEIIDLGSNHFSGSLPLISSRVSILDLSNSSFSGTLFHFLCDANDGLKQLETLHLNNNLLVGEISDCWINWKELLVVNLERNALVGKVPSSIGYLGYLQSLHLRSNNLSGELPISLQNCVMLQLVDLSENKFVGNIPTWIGKSFRILMVLSLRSNELHGSIPYELCSLTNLHILDLANNNLSGSLPRCFNNFTAMTTIIGSGHPIQIFSIKYPQYRSSGDYIEDAIMVTKGREVKYNKKLTLVASLDISNNIISGEIPEELTTLMSLQSLNLSKNLLTGRIPSKIGNMRWLESLDLSMNQLCGEISPSISNLTFLSVLNLSYNKFTGEIPKSTQLQSFDESSFIGNKLCGAPLEEKCSAIPQVGHQKHRGTDLLEDGWFYLSLGLGFFFGFWSVVGSFLFDIPWINAFGAVQNSMLQKFYRV